MQLFLKLFGPFLQWFYHCFDRLVINGYLSFLTREANVIYFFRQVRGEPVITKELLAQRTRDYQRWVENYAAKNRIPIEWAEKDVRKQDWLKPLCQARQRAGQFGVYFILRSMEQGPTFVIRQPKFPTADPNYRTLRKQRSRYTYYYFYILDPVAGPMVLRVGSFLPFNVTGYFNGHHQPAESISLENLCLSATKSSGCRQQSEKASFNSASVRVPRLSHRMASNAGSKSCAPTSTAALRQLSRSKMMAFDHGSRACRQQRRIAQSAGSRNPRAAMSYVMVDVESDGPIPGDYSMICFGAVMVEPSLSKTFYGQLHPISDRWIPEALAVSGFTREQTLAFPEPEPVMRQFAAWLSEHRADRAMFVSDNNGFDWQFINWYFHHFTGSNPFGFSSTNLGSLYKGVVRDTAQNFKHLRKTRHTHHPVDDAKGNAEALLALQKEFGLKIRLESTTKAEGADRP